MDRLSAPDLTAAEANDLRPRLMGLLQSLEGPGSGAASDGPVVRASVRPARG